MVRVKVIYQLKTDVFLHDIMLINVFYIQDDICEIDGVCYELDDVNPGDSKYVCKPNTHKNDWTLVSGTHFVSI